MQQNPQGHHGPVDLFFPRGRGGPTGEGPGANVALSWEVVFLPLGTARVGEARQPISHGDVANLRAEPCPGRGGPTAKVALSWEVVFLPLGTARYRSIYGHRAGQGKSDHRPSPCELPPPTGEVARRKP